MLVVSVYGDSKIEGLHFPNGKHIAEIVWPGGHSFVKVRWSNTPSLFPSKRSFYVVEVLPHYPGVFIDLSFI